MSKVYDENVLVFDVKILSEVTRIPINGIRFYASDYLDAIFSQKNSSRVKMLDRNIAERCETWLQIIPYILVRSTSESGECKYLGYQRGKSGGENRLHEKYSIGVGGHINDVDAVYDNGLNVQMTIVNNIRRELKEEINLPLSMNAQPLAVLHDMVNEVGRVHFGIVFIFDTNNEMVQAMEDCIEMPEFFTVEELKNMNLENWSSLIVKELL